MRFIDEWHKKAFFAALSEYHANRNYNEEVALLYLLTATHDCRTHMDDLMEDVDEVVIKKDATLHPWVTSSDGCIIRLAFNLFSSSCPTVPAIEPEEGRYDTVYRYFPTQIFWCLGDELFAACLEAIRIWGRFRGVPAEEDCGYFTGVW